MQRVMRFATLKPEHGPGTTLRRQIETVHEFTFIILIIVLILILEIFKRGRGRA